ncbi:hypothetical protein OROMI_021906 [Orobanche minor]
MYYACKKAHRLDPISSGRRGVRCFKWGLVASVLVDNASSLSSRVKKTDARELESFYKQYYEQYVVSSRLIRENRQIDLSSGRLTRLLEYFLKCFVQSTRLRKFLPEVKASVSALRNVTRSQLASFI